MAELFRQLRQKILPILLSLLLLLIALWIELTPNHYVRLFVNRVSYLVYDIRLNLALDQSIGAHPQIVIVDIDEKSLSKLGHWPWPRKTISRLVQAIRERGALVVAFDVVFSEPEANIANTLARNLDQRQIVDNNFIYQLKKFEPLFAGDLILSGALRAEDNILSFFFHRDANIQRGWLPKNTIDIGKIDPEATSLISMPGYTANISVLHKRGVNAGFINTFVDKDGVLRRAPLVMRFGSKAYPSLALAAAKLYLLADKITLHFTDIKGKKVIEALSLDKQYIATDEHGQIGVPFKGGKQRYKYYSAVDILQGKLKRGALKNKLVFVGSSAIGLADLVPTPIHVKYPGVQVHADIAAGILANFFPFKPTWAAAAEVVSIVFFGLLLAFILPWLRIQSLFIVIFIAFSSLTVIDIWLWSSMGYILSFAVTILLIFALALLNFIYGFFFEGRRHKVLINTFSHYVPPAYLDKISEDPEAYGFEGKTQTLSLLFADIRDFTSISETLSADQIKYMLNYYLTVMTDILIQHNATIDKYVGDMVIAFWGAPVADEEHKIRALNAALAMRAALPKISAHFSEQSLPKFHIGIGLHSGLVNVGDMGSKFRRAYTVIGDTVNLTSRLESLTRYYKVDIIVSEAIVMDNPDYLFRKLGRVRVKGRKEVNDIYELLGNKVDARGNQFAELTSYHDALELYYAKQW
nr:adenylate/guanylate cyclase domain-containing protein [Gammaproteobacteria bacterium]